MEFQFAWLLALPLFFALGWIAGRLDLRQLLSESRQLPAAYFRGLNFLLNEQQDQAIEAFAEVARDHQPVTELHFALGSLFRRRGELDRATRMHQALVDRADLPATQRRLATHELAQDFLKAGLLDRAEALFESLRGTELQDSALRFLRDIYVSEKDWDRAIQVAGALPVRPGLDNPARDIANYLCELAALDYVQGRRAQAQERLTEALATNRRCVRATILQGDWLQREGDLAGAIERWAQVEQQNADYLFLVADPVLQAWRQRGDPAAGLQMVQGWLERHPGLDLLQQVAQATRDQRGAQAAWLLVRTELHRSPSLAALQCFLDARLHVPAEDGAAHLAGEARADAELVRELVQRQVTRQSVFVCRACGFKARKFHWHCPACGQWESFPPRRHAEVEALAQAPSM